ncbi:cation diffusion facilitator family transporter [Balneolaceae bacterium ANBcel3]|nr:cation diffusion facilitator family transporter [Balneolaceae bacterium ANBcel3]
MALANRKIKTTNKKSLKAIKISLFVSVFVFLLKLSAYVVTGSASVLSDAAESFIHIFAVGFSTFGLIVSLKPADSDHPYGHERISFFAVGAEGMLILIAAITILYQSLKGLILGTVVLHIEAGAGIIAISAFINLVLGLYLIKTGKKENNMILIGNGKHTLTDVYTSSGVILTLILISWTGWLFLDAFVAIGIAAFISLEGYRLTSYSIKGLMDKRDSETDKKIRELLDKETGGKIKNCHDLRHRNTGMTLWVEFHALFEAGMSLEEAHLEATRLEKKLMDHLTGNVVVTIHLEPEEVHVHHHQTIRDIS